MVNKDDARGWDTLESSFFITDGEYLGIANQALKTGDSVALFDSLDMPMIVRASPIQGDGSFEVIGPVYVRGIMSGERWDSAVPLHQFILV